MQDAPLKEKPLDGERWTRPWHLWLDSLKRAFTFLGLTDTPDSYAGNENKYPRVKSDGTGIEFVNGTPVTVTHNDSIGLQGGSSTERYHLDQSRRDRVNTFLNGGTITHTGVDGHVADVNNPHNVTANQVLPNQSGQAGKILGTDGVNAGWIVAPSGGGSSDHTALTNIGVNTHVQIDSHISSTSNPHNVTANQVLPTQAGQAGKTLVTDGTSVSWQNVSGLPDYDESEYTYTDGLESGHVIKLAGITQKTFTTTYDAFDRIATKSDGVNTQTFVYSPTGFLLEVVRT